MAWVQRSPGGTREALASRALRLKQESREGEAWVVGVAERPVGVKTRVTSAEQRSLSSKATQQVGQERRLAKTYDLLRSSGNYKKRCMPKQPRRTSRGRKHEITLVRKPDAGKPHVRFDERGCGNGSATGYRATPRLYLPSRCDILQFDKRWGCGRARPAPGAWQSPPRRGARREGWVASFGFHNRIHLQGHREGRVEVGNHAY